MTADLRPPAEILCGLIRDVSDDQLTTRTPCGGIPVGELLDHIDTFAVAFTGAATKSVDPGPPPTPDVSHLGDDWRDRIPTRLTALADAWAAPESRSGHTSAGGLPMAADEAAAVALNEVLVHGWDLAVALGRRYPGDDPALADAVRAAHAWVDAIAASSPDGIPGLFGPRVKVPADAPLFDQLIAATGRVPR
ncbi:TIGR03086 family metal-binding protein [Cryptosporangium aurantiacum]|uniref:TIGR03086 family protein n=1 Tax=Cryptosporangium aurantiacum TaxID=134849 RepID=A0A1M7R9C6_9ACTN|nr:TIGR03086 family metal-binding protein [Cryptosporangium aurantiacum]SHN42752.1 TIGR03086 family protein [Cryptosporangium aurantiacum]